MSTAASTYAAAVLADYPLGFWPLQQITAGSTPDSVTPGHPASVVGGVTVATGGPMVGANGLTFNGTTGLLTVGTAATFALTVFTLEIWAKFTSTTIPLPLLGRIDSTHGYALYAANGFFQLQLNAPSGNVSIGAVAASNDGQWHHVVGTCDGTNGRLYVDGVLQGSPFAVPVGGVALAPTAPLQMAAANSTANKFAGTLAYAAVYGVALTPTQITTHLNATTATNWTNALPSVILADGPVAYWPLNDAGPTGADASGHGYTLTATGGVTWHQARTLNAWRGPVASIDGVAGHGLQTTTLTPIPAQFTCDAWFNLTAVPPAGAYAYFFGSRDGASNALQHFALYCPTATMIQVAVYLAFTGTPAPAWLYISSPLPLQFGVWYHLAYTFDGTTLTVYINGGAIYATTQYAGRTFLSLGTTTGTRTVGTNPANNTAFYGPLADLAWYDKALSAAQVYAHYYYGVNGQGHALMYAQGKIARGGATRGGYHSNVTYIAIGGIQVGEKARTNASARVLLDSLTITDALDQPNTCECVTTGFAPTVGQPILIQKGSINTLSLLFGGRILSATQVYLADNPANVAYQLHAIDATWLLDRRQVIATYKNWSATAIALDLMTRFTSGFSTSGVQTGLAVLDEITFTNTAVSDALAQLAKRIGGYWYVDYNATLHLFVGTETQLNAPAPLTKADRWMRHVTRQQDLSQMLTRVYHEGGGASAQALCVPGETILPVETVAWYNANGGTVTSGPQRIAYTRIFAGGGGTVVGPGVQPAAAPQLTQGVGAGVPTGAHDYAVTFVTASGESLPSPRASITVGPMASPTAAPTAAPKAGSGVESGVHNYAYSWVTSDGETLVSPLGAVTLGPTQAAPVHIGQAVVNPFGTGPLTVNANFSYAYTFKRSSDGAETTPSPLTSFNSTSRGQNGTVPLAGCDVAPSGWVRTWYRTKANLTTPYLIPAAYVGESGGNMNENAPDSVLGAAAPTTNGTAQNQATISNIATGPVGLTARKLYRTTAGGVPLLLLATISDNTTTTYTDTTPDASLGAAAPTTNTAQANLVALSGIPLGPTGTTQRRLYRTKVGLQQLLLLTGLGDNTTTAISDAQPDSALGVAAPTSDTSLLQQPQGTVLAGSTSLLLAGAAAFRVTGGWALLASGQQIRYTGISGNFLTGIPATGPGAILATISYGTTVTAAPALEGVTGIVVSINPGDEVNLYVTVNDTAAQALLASLIGGDGVQEAYFSDNRISETEARARANAYLTLRNQIDQMLAYTTRDQNTCSGATVTVSIDAPTNMTGTYKIQQVTLSEFQFLTLPPLRTVQASSTRYTFEDLLRLARLASG